LTVYSIGLTETGKDRLGSAVPLLEERKGILNPIHTNASRKTDSENKTFGMVP
jgi:hypothetical protein